MKVVTHRTPDDWDKVNVYLFADWHWGSKQCKMNNVLRMVKLVAEDPHGLWIGCGDLGENALISSVSDVYEQTVNPQSQLAQLSYMLSPIADKCLAIVSGNHGQRTKKGAGLDVDAVMWALANADKKSVDMDKLKLKDILSANIENDKFCGYTGVVNLQMGSKSRTRWTICVHHGSGGGRTKGGKANAIGRLDSLVEGSDVYVVAHVHDDIYFSKRVAVINPPNGIGGASIRWERRHTTSCLSALDYGDSYAEAKMMPPAAIGQVVLELGHRIQRKKDHSDPNLFEKPFKRNVIYF